MHWSESILPSEVNVSSTSQQRLDTLDTATTPTGNTKRCVCIRPRTVTSMQIVERVGDSGEEREREWGIVGKKGREWGIVGKKGGESGG